MSKKLPENPFRDGSASHKLYTVLGKAEKPLTMAEISKRAKVPFEKAQTLVRAYQNPFHNAPLRRAGIAIANGKEGFALATCKAQPNAKRPERGEGKGKKPAKGKKVAARRKRPKATKPSPKSKLEPVPVTAQEQIAPNDSSAQ